MELPSSVEIEKLVLGALLCADPRNTPVEVILSNLESADFHIENHRRILGAMKSLISRGIPVNNSSVISEVADQLLTGSPISFVVELSAAGAAIHDYEPFLGQLREKSMLRRLIADVRDVQERALKGEPSLELFGDLHRIGENLKPKGPSELLEAEQIIEQIGINEFVQPKKQVGIDPPTSWLRNYLRFEPKTMTTLAARTSAGKSAFALQCMLTAAQAGHRTALFSLEMSNRETLRRMVGQHGKVNMHRLRIGIGTDDERAEERGQASQAAWRIAELGDCLLFSDSNSGTVPAIRQHLHRMRLARKPVEFVIVDYLQLMTGVGKFDNRTGEVSSLSRGMKTISQDFDIPVLVLSQLSRKADEANREPQLSDLRESGTIEQDSDNVIFLHRRGNQEEEEQAFRMFVKKARNGPCGGCDLTFVKRYARFEETPDRKAAA